MMQFKNKVQDMVDMKKAIKYHTLSFKDISIITILKRNIPSLSILMKK